MDILYFAWVREAVGVSREHLDPPAEVATVAGLMGWLAQRGAGHARAFADPTRLRAAVNQDLARPDTPVAAGDEVAFFPPMTGG